MTESRERAQRPVSAVRRAVGETFASLRTVAENPGLRRLNLALAGSLIGDWAYSTAIIVWAYQHGGATAVGVWAAVRLGLAAVATPFGAVLADRYPRIAVMVASDLLRATLVLSVAAVLVLDGPSAAVYVLATAASLAGAAFRPAQLALLPSLVRSPSELTAANGVGSTLESLAFFVGPAIGGLLLTVASIPVVLVVNAATFLWSAALVFSIRRNDAEPTHAEAEPIQRETDDSEEQGPFWTETMAGFATVWADRDLRLITGLYCLQTLVAGASIVFEVSIAIDLVGLGPQGVGYLDSVMGIGALVGGLVAVARGPKGRLARDFGVGVLLWGAPLVLISVWPAAAVAFVAMLLIGLGNPLADVNAVTIQQRLVADSVMGRVFGAVDAVLIAAMAVGSLVMPALIALVGLQWSLALIAAPVIVITLLAFPRLAQIDGRLREPEHLKLLSEVSLFAPLQRPELEALALQLAPVAVPAGARVIAQGDEADRFYLIETGDVDVVVDGRPIGHLSAGDCFGEIGLLRDVPRTASIVAASDCLFQTLDREQFVEAMASPEVRLRADALAAKRQPTF
jgi:MFS family permease